MLKLIARKDGQIRKFENGIEEVLAYGASQYIYISADGSYAYYLANSKHWHNGDLYFIEEGKKPILLGTKVNLIYVSQTAHIVVFIDKYFEGTSSAGSLYIVRNGNEKKCLDTKVSSNVIFVQKEQDKYKIYYEKRSKKEFLTLKSGFIVDELDNKTALGTKFTDVRFFQTNEDQLRIVCKFDDFSRNEPKYFMFHEEELVNRENVAQSDALEAITFSTQNNSLQQQFYEQIQWNNDTLEDIVFQFSSNKCSRYFIACEIVKRAKKHIILQSPYEQDDSINHIAYFSPDQKDEILLLYYTLTTGVDFLHTFKLFDVNVQDIMNNIGTFQGKLGIDFAKIINTGLMNLDTSEKIMYGNIVQTLMETHQFQYKQHLKAYLMKTYHDPVENRLKQSTAYYEQFIKTKEDRLHLQDEMKRIEEQLILTGKIPTKWKSELQMFPIIKNEFPTARLHASPSWLQPQHLDVFIEELQLAFEYQGEQHFLAIDFFGGDVGFKKRVKLDNRKKGLCKKNDVQLIEWMYYETVTKLELKRKLSLVKIKS